jgi:hypothetical protein
MDVEISRLVNKEYGARLSSITPVPSDDQLRRLLNHVAGSQTTGLSWTGNVHPEFKHRLETLGFKLYESGECWNWEGSKADNSKRPKFEDRQAYLFTLAALANRPYETHTTLDSAHVCDNSLCVRPGLGHVDQNLRSIHIETGKRGGVRPNAARKVKP